MSFIDTYMKKHRLGDISQSSRKYLDQLEEALGNTTQKSEQNISFLDAIKEYGEDIADLIERVQRHFDGWNFTWTNMLLSLKFVISIAIEVYQIIDSIRDRIVPAGVTGDKAWEIQREFGMKLVYFIWKVISPLKGLRWIPFKKILEKKLVFWLAGMGIDTARNMFNANKEISPLTANNKKILTKAL